MRPPRRSTRRCRETIDATEDRRSPRDATPLPPVKCTTVRRNSVAMVNRTVHDFRVAPSHARLLRASDNHDARHAPRLRLEITASDQGTRHRSPQPTSARDHAGGKHDQRSRCSDGRMGAGYFTIADASPGRSTRWRKSIAVLQLSGVLSLSPQARSRPSARAVRRKRALFQFGITVREHPATGDTLSVATVTKHEVGP